MRAQQLPKQAVGAEEEAAAFLAVAGRIQDRLVEGVEVAWNLRGSGVRFLKEFEQSPRETSYIGAVKGLV